MKTSTDNLRALPSVDALLKKEYGAALIQQYGHPATTEALRQTLDTLREALRRGDDVNIHSNAVLASAEEQLRRRFQPTLRAVINATGIILHTNLGRAPLSHAAQQAMLDVAAGYSTLEYDLESGKRGSRTVHAEMLLSEVTGAEAALVVNNNASALLLVLSAFAAGRDVVISRGQLIEIGGGFRIPDVMAQSGARLVEVGTTNRTRAADYERAVAASANTALLLRAHASNFKQIGFVEQTPLEAMVELARASGLIVVDDLGSGALLDTAVFGLDHEPMVQESLSAGCDVVCFSGDKLLGGPQAGIVVGKKTVIDQLKRHPLARAVRADKLCLAALYATLDHYRRDEAVERIPIWQMIACSLADLRAAAERWASETGGSVIDGESAVGGGSLPGATLPTALLAFDVPHADEFLRRLRAADPPIIARVAAGRVLLDPRTVLPSQELLLLNTLKALLL